jgi:hypothetical protein
MPGKDRLGFLVPRIVADHNLPQLALERLGF